jgi:pilus assembly protein CpaE
LTETTSACIAQSDQVAIIMNAELPSVRNSVRYLEHLTRLGYDSNAIQIVLNRYSKRGPLSDERIEKALQRNISLRIPNSYAEVIKAINSGSPITSDSKSEFGLAIREWARSFTAPKNSAPDRGLASKPAPSGMLGLFSRG